MEEKGEHIMVNLEEQEVNINFIHEQKKVFIYTNKRNLLKIFFKELGKAKKIDTIKEKIVSAEWEINFEDEEKLIKAFNILGDDIEKWREKDGK